MNYQNIISPKSVEDFLIPTTTVSILKQWNPFTGSSLLLYGPPGCGKSTCLRLLSEGVDALHLTATVSSDNRLFLDSAKRFATSVSLTVGQQKVIVIDEIDALTEKEQRMVSSILDSTSCLLIASTNYVGKVYPALRSRCIGLNFNPDQLTVTEVAQRLKRNITHALQTNGAVVPIDVVVKCIQDGFPDFRKIGLLLNATA